MPNLTKTVKQKIVVEVVKNNENYFFLSGENMPGNAGFCSRSVTDV